VVKFVFIKILLLLNTVNKTNITTLDLLRHGKLKTVGLFCADANEPDSEQGRQDLINITKDKSWDVIISSPATRCATFAKERAKQSNTKLIINKTFQEMDFGDWIGKSTDSIWQDDKALFEQLWQSPERFIAPNGESVTDFSNRIQQGLDVLLKQYENQSILLLTHAGVIRSILSVALEISPISALKVNVDYAQMIRLHCYPDGQFSLQSSIYPSEAS